LPGFNLGELVPLGRDPDGAVRFRLPGQAGFRYLIERRGDTPDWKPFLTLDAPTGDASFSDRADTADPVALYRARLLD
jgi:hypothetical protein